MFTSRYLPCPECGGSVDRAAQTEHRCDPERRLEFWMFRLRQEIAGFESAWQRFLHSPTGRFEVWLAARQVRRDRG